MTPGSNFELVALFTTQKLEQESIWLVKVNRLFSATHSKILVAKTEKRRQQSGRNIGSNWRLQIMCPVMNRRPQNCSQ